MEWASDVTKVLFDELTKDDQLREHAFMIIWSQFDHDTAAAALRDWVEKIWWKLAPDHALLIKMGEAGPLANVHWRQLSDALAVWPGVP